MALLQGVLVRLERPRMPRRWGIVELARKRTDRGGDSEKAEELATFLKGALPAAGRISELEVPSAIAVP
jgi:hypothetical protein